MGQIVGAPESGKHTIGRELHRLGLRVYVNSLTICSLISLGYFAGIL